MKNYGGVRQWTQRLMFFLYTFLIFVDGALSQTQGTLAVQKSDLPKCIKDSKIISDIESSMNAANKRSTKYDGYKKALRDSSDEELMHRLIYAEVLAARCPELDEQILPFVVGVIKNRVEKRQGNIISVVFERDQFASSLNKYSESMYKEFLCPKDVTLWSLVKTMSQKKSILPSEVVHYYLFKHHAKWNSPPWSFEEAQQSRESAVRECLRAYYNKAWR